LYQLLCSQEMQPQPQEKQQETPNQGNKRQIQRVILWGFKLHYNTHSYIHNAFYRAFQSLNVPVFWFDDSDLTHVNSMELSHTLFITEHNTNKNIPCRDDCLYFSHYVDAGDYPGVPKENIIVMKVSQRDFTEEDKDMGKNITYEPLEYGQPWEYHAFIDGYHCLYLYWATDILPNEIDENIAKLKSGALEEKKRREVHFIGYFEEIWVYFKYLLGDRGIPFHKHGGAFSFHSHENRSIDQNMDLVQTSLISPALQSDHQVKHRYIPCRIFKNISYGRMGVTNNPAVQELFSLGGHEIICTRDMNELIDGSIGFENTSLENRLSKIVPLMEYVRDHHTYYNRIASFCRFLEDYTDFMFPIPGLRLSATFVA